MSFLPAKRLTSVGHPVRNRDLIQNDPPTVARILFNCPRATIVGREKHLMGLTRSIESP